MREDRDDGIGGSQGRLLLRVILALIFSVVVCSFCSFITFCFYD